jgi:glyoxylate reductase
MTDEPLVYLTRDVPQAGLDRLEQKCETVVWDGEAAPPHDHLVDRLAELRADALFCNVADCVDEEVMDASPELKSIGTMSVGYDHIDLEAAIE